MAVNSFPNGSVGFMLILGILLFGGTHVFFMLVPQLRAQLVARFGERTFKGGYALASALGLIFLALAYVNSRNSEMPEDQLYVPWDSGRHVILLLVLIGFILIFSNGSKGYIRRALKHPFSIGVAIWSIAHLLANGEKVVVAIFGTLLVIAVLDIILSTVRGKTHVHEPVVAHDLRSLLVGVALYLIFLFGFHPYVLGVPVI